MSYDCNHYWDDSPVPKSVNWTWSFDDWLKLRSSSERKTRIGRDKIAWLGSSNETICMVSGEWCQKTIEWWAEASRASASGLYTYGSGCDSIYLGQAEVCAESWDREVISAHIRVTNNTWGKVQEYVCIGPPWGRKYVLDVAGSFSDQSCEYQVMQQHICSRKSLLIMQFVLSLYSIFCQTVWNACE